MGKNTAEGFAIGLRRSAPGVRTSADAISGAAVSGMGGGSSRRGGSGGAMVHYSPTFVFEVTGSDAEDIANRAMMKAKTEFRTFAEQYFAQQFQMGTA
jgi:hypothetical protein